ncbi:hypothetical protein Y032_0003g1627 [Ancylostoma ceylanicum]|uniref:Uncharacterized protein n=1 Tax=Ancylostoma ceylanicum TaxID=53326 RepID=A0A016VYQ9_9BILA|nr:hypothetical protein Y032_0003g1627 [Ancylostoma ceylanicum]
MRGWITPAMATRLNPYRNIFFAVAIISVVFSILIVVENVFFLSATGNRNVFLLLLPYLLSWALVTVACVFARVAFLLRASNVKCVVRPQSPSAWSADSRPVSPTSMETLSASYNSQMYLFRSTLSVPQSPFCISDEVQRYTDEPPSYDEAVRRSNVQAVASASQ